jgi:hypothetical protein
MESDYVRGTLVPKSFLEPLGYLVAWFALLEQNVNAAIEIFLDLEQDRGQIMAAQFNSMTTKLEILRLLAEKQIVAPEWKAAFASVLKRAKDANDSRNSVIHGNWSYSIPTMMNPHHSISKTSLTKSGKQRSTSLDSNKIMKAAKDSLDAAFRLEIALRDVKRIKPKGWPPR